MSSKPGELILLTINHESVPLEERERFSLAEAQIDELYKTLQSSTEIEESLILNTCNRFEIYFKAPDSKSGSSKIVDSLSAFYGVSKEDLQTHAKTRYGADAVQHLIEVSAGLRSQITGETEIFGQVKNAYSKCQNLGYAGALINRMFQKGFQAAKLIRHTTPIGEGQINVSNVAVNLSLKIFGSLREVSALIIGTGDIGQKTAKALRSRGASSFGIASRSSDRVSALAGEWGGVPRHLDDLHSYLNKYDIVISSTESKSPIVTLPLLQELHPLRRNRPLFLIDLGLPRNVDPNCDELEEVYLYNLDDLAKIANENLMDRRKAIETSAEIAAQKSAAIWKTLQKRGLVNSQ